MTIDLKNPDDKTNMISAITDHIQSSLDDKSVRQHAEIILDEYIVRTNHHIWLVNQCAKILKDIVAKYGQDTEMFMTNCEFHDYDKLHESEIIPIYALACNYFYFHNKKVNYKVDEEWLKHEFENIIWPKHHQKNKHHYAEYYGTKDENGFITVPEEYDVLSLCEMYADWMAMGIVKDGTARDWWHRTYGKGKKWIFEGRDLGVIQSCIIAEEKATNQLAYLKQFKEAEPSWVPPTEIETHETEEPIEINRINEGIENFFNYQSNEGLALKRDDLFIGPIDITSLDTEKLMKLYEYPAFLLTLKKWSHSPNYDLAPQLSQFGKIVNDIYKFTKPITCYRGIRTGFDSRSNKSQNLMGVIDNEIEYLRLLKPGFNKPGVTFDYDVKTPLSVARSPYIAKIYGNFIIKADILPDTPKLVITPELAYILQQMEVDYPEMRAVNLSTTHEVIVLPGAKLTFEIVSVFGDISNELETMKDHALEGLGFTPMNGIYYSIEDIKSVKDNLPEYLYILGTIDNLKDGYISFRKADTTWDEQYKEWNNNFDVYKSPASLKKQIEKPNNKALNTIFYALGLPVKIIKDSVFFEKGRLWFRPQKNFMIKAKDWKAIKLSEKSDEDIEWIYTPEEPYIPYDEIEYGFEEVLPFINTGTFKKITDLAKPCYKPIGQNSWEHIQQVYSQASRICKKLFNRSLNEIEYASCLFHDCSVIDSGKEQHNIHSAEKAKQILKALFNEQELDIIYNAILEHDNQSVQGQWKFSSSASEFVAAGDFNPPDAPWMMNKSYTWGITHGLDHEERIENMVALVKRAYGSNGEMWLHMPEVYKKYFATKINTVKKLFDKITPEEAEKIVITYRKKHHLSDTDINLPTSSVESLKSYGDFANSKEKRIIKDLVNKYYDKIGSHGWNHISEVLATAEKLVKRTLTLVEYTAIVCHDLARKEMDEGHPARSVEIAREILPGTNLFSAEELAEIYKAIGAHGDKHEFASELCELVACADRCFPKTTIEDLYERPILWMLEGSDKGKPTEKEYDVSDDLSIATRAVSQIKKWCGDIYDKAVKEDNLYTRTFKNDLKKTQDLANTTTPEQVVPLVKKLRTNFSTEVHTYDTTDDEDPAESHFDWGDFFGELVSAFKGRSEYVNIFEDLIETQKGTIAFKQALQKALRIFDSICKQENNKILTSTCLSLTHEANDNMSEIPRAKQTLINSGEYIYPLFNESSLYFKRGSVTLATAGVKERITLLNNRKNAIFKLWINVQTQSKLAIKKYQAAKNESVTNSIEKEYVQAAKDILSARISQISNQINQFNRIQNLIINEYNKEIETLKTQFKEKNKSTESLSTKEYTESDINSVEDLKDFYKHCSYGIPKIYKSSSKDDFENDWKLLSADQVLKYKCAICYDTAKMNDYFLTKWKIEHVNLFGYTKRSAGDDYNDDPTHTFTVYKDTDGKWKWLEGSWGTFKNNDWSESAADALIKNIGKALANDKGVSYLIGVIKSWPSDGVKMNEFYHAIKKDAITNWKYEVSPDASYSKEALNDELNWRSPTDISSNSTDEEKEKLHSLLGEYVYHGGPIKYNILKPTSRKDFDEPVLFFSPFAYMASLFCTEHHHVRKGLYDNKYVSMSSWTNNTNTYEGLDKPAVVVEIVHNIKDLKPYTIIDTGYLHCVKTSKVINNILPYNRWDKYYEFVYFGNGVSVDKIIPVKQTIHVRYDKQCSIKQGGDAIPSSLYAYRILYNNVGIYEAFKQNVSSSVWNNFKNSDIATWLPIPEIEYKTGYKSYFTEKGLNEFCTKVLPYFKDHLNNSLITIEQYDSTYLNWPILYSDKYQFVTNGKEPTQCTVKSISEFSNEALSDKTSKKKITFPKEEIETIKKQDRIITTRVSKDYETFQKGDLVETPWYATYKISDRKEISKIEDHPYYKELTKEQIAFLSKYDKIAVLTLIKVTDQETKTSTEVVSSQENFIKTAISWVEAENFFDTSSVDDWKKQLNKLLTDKKNQLDITKVNNVTIHLFSDAFFVLPTTISSDSEEYVKSVPCFYHDIENRISVGIMNKKYSIETSINKQGIKSINEYATFVTNYVEKCYNFFEKLRKFYMENSNNKFETLKERTAFGKKCESAFGYVTFSIKKILDLTKEMLTDKNSFSNEALAPDIKKKKQLIIDYICSVCDIMDPSKLNSKRYHRLLDSMNDKEFDQWMNYVKEGKWKIHIVAPNLVVTLKNENSLKAADKVKCKLFHRLWMTDDSTGRQYLTDNEYLVLNLPVRRQQQFLDEKMSVPDNDRQIDGMTGQVTGDSKSSAVTNPEIQILAARGLDATLEELVNVRGGNIAAYSDFKRQAEETGEIKLNSLDPNTRSRVAVVGQVLLRSMMIENNIVE